MVAANKLLHLLEAFSTTWFLFSAAQNHHLVFFLLEVFNNIIQYQFDGQTLALAPGPALGAGTRAGSSQGCHPIRGGHSPPLPPVGLANVHLWSTCCMPSPVLLGAGHTVGNKAECFPPRRAHSWGGKHEGDFKQRVTQRHRSS